MRALAGPWQADILGEGYEQRVIELGDDPDGEGSIQAVLVRRAVREQERVDGAVLYVHGFAEHFFQTALADFFAARSLAFYAVDLRKCGRARGPAHTAHYVTDLEAYDVELDASLQVVADDHPGLPVTVVGHSTGGLVTALWLDRRRAAGRVAPVSGQVLNSPWFDLRGGAFLRGPVTWLLRGVSKIQPRRVVAPAKLTTYGSSLHVSGSGEWDYDLDLKPLAGFPGQVGFINAVRRGHARLHRGLNVGVPSLVLVSDKTGDATSYSPESDRADIILDVEQIVRWSGSLGDDVTVVKIPDARHDVFLSLSEVRQRAYDELGAWVDQRTAGVLR